MYALGIAAWFFQELFVQAYGCGDRVCVMFCLPHFSFLQIIGTVDECYVGKSLRIVAQSSDAVGANLFGKQAKLPGITEQTLKQRSCFIDSSLHSKIVDKP